jgi:hypothetical protein
VSVEDFIRGKAGTFARLPTGANAAAFFSQRPAEMFPG